MQAEMMAVIRDEQIQLEDFFENLPARTKEHSTFVADLTARLVGQAWTDPAFQSMALPTPELARQAALYHDIGIALIPDRLFNKDGALTDAEFRVIQQHASYGAKILQKAQHQVDPQTERYKLLSLARQIALGHHERWDGRGYPQMLNGEECPSIARIVAVADAYDSIIRGAEFRMPLPSEYALLEIICNAGQQFDPQIVELFRHTYIQINPKTTSLLGGSSHETTI